MSRTKRRGGSASPIKKYLQFSGSTGMISYYDREAKERVELEEISIIVLDVRASITGYDATNKAQITSNMVADTGKDKLKVVSIKDKKVSDVAEGLYKNIKSSVGAKNGKFTTNVICLADVGDGQEMCNLQLTGVGVNSWISFADSLGRDGEYDHVITLKRGELSKVDGKKIVAVTGKEEKELDAKLKKNPRAPRPVWFYTVDFDTEELTEEQLDEAASADEQLQKYFEGATDNSSKEGDSEEEAEEEEDSTLTEEENDDFPF